ncbi:hypothetical protein MiYa_04709 [Microcystis aeruginosa NIES-2519]|uniref:Uncharacterized protein n=1 Tax=Microcystis aeruginosa NIES-2519 TaxID=2303981 RepID=A0A5A5RAU9_MICAE|nr:hypothetical protein MiYa_04709 [Microcystis aeruginosa NIES-2519]
MRPETVRSDHGVGFFRLGGFKSSESVGTFTVFKQGIFYRRSVNSTEKRTTEDTSYTHHVEGVEGPVVEALEEENKTEDTGHAEARGKEPARLTEGVHQEDTDEHRNRTGEGEGVVGTNAD